MEYPNKLAMRRRMPTVINPQKNINKKIVKYSVFIIFINL